MGERIYLASSWRNQRRPDLITTSSGELLQRPARHGEAD